MAAVRVTRIRLADSLQQGVVWFSTYEGMRAAMSIYDEKRTELDWAEKLRAPEGFTVAPEPFSEGSVSAGDDAAVDAAALGTASHETPAAAFPRRRFARRAASSESASASKRVAPARRRASGMARASRRAADPSSRARDETRKRDAETLETLLVVL